MDYLNYSTKQSIERLANDLNLTKGDCYTQDWEYEVVDSTRIQDFLLYYESTKLNPNEKELLMRLILESYNDYVTEFGFNSVFSAKLKKILSEEKSLHEETIEFWACKGDELGFAITPFIREIND